MSENDMDDPTYSPAIRRRGRTRKEDDPDLNKIPQHLVEGYRILQDIMGVTKFFHQDPNPIDKGLYDYYMVINQPICFYEIKRKFVEKEYTQMSEFVYDVRLLLLNCYRFFGPNNIKTKRALRVEQLLEQKLALLSEEQRELCSLQATHGKLENVENAAVTEGRDESKLQFESKLLKSVEKEKASRIIERKQKLASELCAETEGKEKEMVLWEKETLFMERDYEMMKHMWEIPVIGHFVTLAIYPLNIQRISMYEIERMFMMPQASKCLARLMTSLLSTPLTRLKIHTKPSMPYKIWAKKLALKVSGWYKIYNKSNNNAQTVFEKLGIEHQFWKMFGDSNPLEDYEFHELTFHQRVFLVKTLCDYILQNHKLIRDTVAEMTEDFGICLGEDHTGAKYIYFPQFLNLAVRVYKQNLDSKTWVDRDMDHEAVLFKAKTGNKLGSKLKRKKCKRKSPWISGIVKKRVTRHKKQQIKLKCVISINSQRKVQVVDDKCVTAHTKLGSGESLNSVQRCSDIEDKDLETGERKYKTELVDNEDILNEQRKDDSCLCASVCECEKLKVMTDNLKSEMSESTNDGNHEKVKPVFVKTHNEHIMKGNEESKNKKSLYHAKWLEPSPDDFVLVADSVQGVRELLEKFCDDDVELIHRLINSKKGKSNRPRSEVKLARRLCTLIEDLESLELKLVLERKKILAKLYEEWQEFKNRPSDFVDPDEAFWLNEKEPVENHECEVPDIPTVTQSSIQMVELPQTPDIYSCDASAGGMTLRHRRVETPPDKELAQFYSSDTEEQSSEDESDNWVMPKNRKRKRTKQLRCILANQPNKKKESLEKPTEAQEDSAKTTNSGDPDIEIVGLIKRTPKKNLTTAAALRVKKCLFYQNEANRQLEWEKNRQKLVNMASNKSAKELKTMSPKTKIILDSSNKILLDNSGIISIPSTNSNQALTHLQGRKLDDVIKQGKVVKGRAVITGVIGVEMKSPDTSDSKTENSNETCKLMPYVNGGKTTFIKVLEKKCDSDAANVNRSAVPPHVPQSNTLNVNTNAFLNLNSASPQSSNTRSVNLNANSVQYQAQNKQSVKINTILVSTPSVTKSPPLTAQTVSVDKSLCTPSRPLQNVSQSEEVVVLSDESDNDVEFIEVVYNPKLHKNLAAQRKTPTKCLVQKDKSMSVSMQGQLNTRRRSCSVNPGLSVKQEQENSNSEYRNNSSTQKQFHMTSEPSPQHDKNSNAITRFTAVSVLPIRTPDKGYVVNDLKNYGNSVPKATMSMQNNNQNMCILQTSNSVTAVPQTTSANVQRNCIFTTQLQKSCISSSIPSSSLPHESVTVTTLEISLGTSVQQSQIPETPSSNAVRGNLVISPGSTISQPRFPGTPRSNIMRGSTISSNSSVSQPRFPGTPRSNIIRGSTISSSSSVSQPRFPGTPTSNILRGNVISPGSIVSQSRIPGTPNVVRGSMFSARIPGTPVSNPMTPSTNIIRGNIIISPTSNVPQPQNSGIPVNRQFSPVQMSVRAPSAAYRLSSPVTPVQRPINSLGTQFRGNSSIISRAQISPRQQIPIAQMGMSGQGRNSNVSDVQILSVTSQNLSPTTGKSIIPSFRQQVPGNMSQLQGFTTPRKHCNTNSPVKNGNQTRARLVVVPGDENTGSNYGLIFPDGNRIILSAKQVADIRAANGGNLPTNVGW